MLVKGRDTWGYGQRELRDMIGYVPQKALLFNGIITDNLRHGKEDATDLRTYHAVAIVQIDDFIREHRKGLDVPVSQGGGSFSGGQKQCLSIARAVIKGPDIFLLGDSFFIPDFKTDAELRKALEQGVKEGAVTTIAQRTSTITDVDQIIVLDEGRIIGKSIRKTSMVDCPVYQSTVQSQLSQEGPT